MLSLNLPTFEAKVILKEGKRMIFDPVRRKYVALTPEEWVRQHFVNFLIHYKGFPPALIGNEIALRLHHTSKRCDTIVYNRFLAPLMIVEYKAPSVEISRAVFDQIARYNHALRVQFLAVSNGLRHFCCRIDYETMGYTFLEDFPDYERLELKGD